MTLRIRHAALASAVLVGTIGSFNPAFGDSPAVAPDHPAAVARTAAAAPPKNAPVPVPAPGPATAPAANPFTGISSNFWGACKQTMATEEFAQAKLALAQANPMAAPAAGARSEPVQRVVDVTIAKPADAAKLLNAANDPASAAAVATVVGMVTTPETREAAVALVKPEAKARAQEMTANLSTGIAGLPGIYLNHDGGTSGGSRASVPSGYTPVPGRSWGCRSR